MRRFIITLSSFLILQLTLEAQSIGLTLGGGFFSSNSPNISAYTSSVFVDSPPIFNNAFSLRLSLLYCADYNQLLPNSTNQYNPFLKGISFKGIVSQDMEKFYYINEGIGILILDDRIFNGIDATDYGVVISFGVGIDLRKNSLVGFRIGAGTDYAFTFTNTYAKYFSIHLLSQYYF